MDVVIDAEQFFTRLDRLKRHWISHKHEFWEGADAVCIPMGSMKDQNVDYSKSSSMHMYLLGYEFPDSLFVLTSTKLFFMAAQKKVNFVEAIKNDEKFPITTLVKTKDEDANRDHFKTILDEIKKGGGSKLGSLMKAAFEGKFIASWIDYTSEAIEVVEAGRGFGSLLSVKDPIELDTCKRAAVLSNKVLKHGFVAEMEEIIDKDEKVTHEDIAQNIEKIIFDPSKLGIKVAREMVESCYTPIIQSGGDYDIRVTAQSNNKPMSFDIIICSLGARYRSYCGNIARTFMIDPPRKVLETYSVLMSLCDKCLEQMVVGNELKDVMEGARAYLEMKKPELVNCLPKSLGFAIGIEFRDSSNLLNSTNTNHFEDGMVFNLAVGLHRVPLSEGERKGDQYKDMKEFSLLVADTVRVQADGVPDVLTKTSRNAADVTYNIADQADEDENDPGADHGAGDGVYTRRSERGKAEKEEAERSAAERAIRQKELMEEKLAQARRKAQRGGNDKGKGTEEEEEATDLNTYPSPEHFPKEATPNRLRVDMQRQAVIVPINGQLIPFHISTIKNVSMPEPDRATYLRINFYSTGMALGKDVPKNMMHLIAKYGSASSFIKELTFRSLDPKNLTTAYRNIQELRKRLRLSEQRAEEEKDLVVQEKLVRIRDQRVPRLQDLTMRPQFSGRKSTGMLESHQNGLRFTSTKGEVMDVMYRNIKHAFFQPYVKSTMILLHFHLKDFILINKKKHKDVQFVTEIVDSSVNLDSQKRSAYDPEELDEEQREIEMKKRLQTAFHDFCRKVEKVAKYYDFNLTFDVPYADLGFYGNPNKEMVFIQPSLGCLVNLTEMPFFVVDLSEIEHVHFERVDFSTKNFDMVIIFKNFDILPRTVVAIEVKYMDMIQDWLSTVNITYTTGPQTMHWKNIMDTIKNDDRFYFDTDESGDPKPAGWNFLTAEGSDDEDDEEDDDDSSFAGESAESEEEEDDSDESDDSFEDEESEGSYDEDADEDLEEQGMSWDELERDAEVSDKVRKQREREDEAADHAPRKKRKSR